MTAQELINTVAEKSDLTAEEAQKVIDILIEEIKGQLSRGEKVMISGFGTFSLSNRKPKTFVNPKTGQAHELPERVLPHFKAGEEFKKNIRN